MHDVCCKGDSVTFSRVVMVVVAGVKEISIGWAEDGSVSAGATICLQIGVGVAGGATDCRRLPKKLKNEIL